MINGFRKSASREGVEQQKQSTLKVSPPPLTLILCFFLAWFFIFLVFLFTQHFTKKETVQGYIEAEHPSTLIRSEINGYIEYIKSPGDSITRAGEFVSVISPNQKFMGVESPSQKGKDSLDKQMNIVENKIETLNAMVAQDYAQLMEQQAFIKQRISQVLELRVLLSQQLDIANKLKTKSKELYKNNVISENEFDDVKLKILPIEQDFLLNHSEYTQLEEKSASLTSAYNDAVKRAEIEIMDLKLFSQRIKEEIYLIDKNSQSQIASPRSGWVSNVMFKQGEYVSAGDLLLTVGQKNPTFKAILWVPSRSFGLIKNGQVIRLQYDAYPYQRFGTYKGVITSVGDYAIDSSEHVKLKNISEPVYKIEVALGSQFISRGGVEFKLTEGMTFKADVEVDTEVVWKWLLEPFFTLQKGEAE